ncbi:MAG TPA: lasso peptide biosynthesis B2 protein [Polyangiaceae bacterium]|nr:lasso peptide biosynthesis B2 protein [Polyangiaceae bacterium]
MGPNRIWSETKHHLVSSTQPAVSVLLRKYNQAQRFLRRPNGEQLLLAEAAVTLAAVKAMLLVVPFERWRHLLRNPPDRVAPQAGATASKAIAVAVAQLSRHSVVALTCLPQALAVRSMMHRRGLRGELRVGVARARDGGIRAHAWVVYEGEVIIGGLPDLDQFTVLGSLDPTLPNALLR